MAEFEDLLKDEDDIERDKELERLELLTRSCIKDVMATKQGRKFVWLILADCGLFQTTFVSGQPDVTSFNEGKRNVAIRLHTLIDQTCADRYAQMISESKQEEESDG